ncbi:MAG: TrkH family potassium uptake protein [Chloroflexi bacterium]|nr:TrkH family potassium uptake protein [Chloroflexota bacterium]
MPGVSEPGVHRALSPIVLLYGFIGIIALGTTLLVLPVSSKSGQFTFFLDALFTATSATCVTGLSTVDVGTHFSHFGQGVIAVLMQLGGFGFMASATILLIVLGRRIGLRERLLVMSSMSLERLGGALSLVKKIAIFTVLVEVVGGVVFFFRFWPGNSMGTAMWEAIFHSISAFNNAGLDIFGNYQSLSGYRTDAAVLLVTAALIILGGISFIVVADILSVRRFARLSLDSKIVIVTTVILLALGTIVILVTEFSNPDTLGPLPWSYKLLNAFFHSVTPRTAGFASISIGGMADYSIFFIVILMFIGGASGSTAGGIKVNTFGMIAASVWSTINGREHPGAFGRRFKTDQIFRGLAVVMLSVGLVALVVLILTITENFSFIQLLFETVSAFGTVGLTAGITPDLSMTGQLIIIVTMLLGRLGPLTVALSLIQRRQRSAYVYPEDEVRIG